MINYPEIDPVAVALGPISIHWYGLTYLIGIASAWWLARLRARMPGSIVPPEQIDDLVFYGALGVVIGGRVGSVLFYNFGSFVDNPLYLFKIWQGGMSFHVGLGIDYLYRRDWFHIRKGGGTGKGTGPVSLRPLCSHLHSPACLALCCEGLCMPA